MKKLLIDKEHLYEILKEFNVITGIKASFVEDYEKPIMSVPNDNSELCLKMQSDDINFYHRCKESDRTSMEKAKELDDIYIYKCHYHLHEAIVPVKIYGHIVGYFVLGQMLVDKNNFIKKNKPNSKELELLKKLATLDMNKLISSAKTLRWLAQYCILSSNINYIQKEDFIIISDYIKNNLHTELSAKFLCKKFHISRSALYALFNKECNLGVAEYINNLRVEKSVELLKNHKVNVVAQMVGIQDSNYFSRVFKKKYGLSPAKYIANLMHHYNPPTV